MFWFFSVIIIIVMMAVLQVMTAPLAAALTAEHGLVIWPLTHRLELLSAGVVLIVFMMISRIWRQRSLSASLDSYHISKADSFEAWAAVYRQVRPHRYHLLSALILALALVVLSALVAMQAQYQAHLQALSKPVRVKALVTIEGLSDSIYDANQDQGLRQVVSLTDITPLGQSDIALLSASQNSLSKNTRSAQSAKYILNPWNKLSSDPNVSFDASSTINPTNTSILANPTNLAITPNADADPPLRVLLNIYPDSDLDWLNDLKPNQQLVMALALAPLKPPPRSNLITDKDTSGFDSYRWLRSRHIDATANLIAIDPSAPLKPQFASNDNLPAQLHQLRWEIRQHFMQNWGQLTVPKQQAYAVTLSLLTGDRALINRDTKDMYQFAGISHLLAISGSHVLFLAIIFAQIVVTVINTVAPRLYAWWPRWQVSWVVMVVTAFMYAAFTGFDVPAARTAWMLVAIGVVRISLLPISPFKVLMVLAIVMAWLDPFVLWQAGFWLSYIAVALLLVYQHGQKAQAERNQQAGLSDKPLSWPYHNASCDRLRQTNTKDGLASKQSLQALTLAHQDGQGFGRKLAEYGYQLIKLQLWLFLALLPLSLMLFEKVSLWGVLINLFAIGWYGLVIVPLNLLAGLSYLIYPELADGIWALTISVVAVTHSGIDHIVQWPLFGSHTKAWLMMPVNLGIILVAALIFVPWFLPKGVVSRWASLPPMLLLLMMMLTSSKTQQSPVVYLLPTDAPYLRAVLLSSGLSAEYWLILADYRPADQSYYRSLNTIKISDHINRQLMMLGVDSLQGIIIQTPDPAGDSGANLTTNASMSSNTSSLLEVTQRLSSSLPIERVWQAGRTQPLLPQQNDTALPTIVPCQLKAQWWSTDQSLSVYAMTGWPDVNQQTVGGCVIAIQSREPITVKRFNASHDRRTPVVTTSATLQLGGNSDYKAAMTNPAQPKASVNLSKSQLSDDQKLPAYISALPDDKAGQPAGPLRHTLILDAANHKHLWQLWQLICPNPQAVRSLGSIMITHQDAQTQPTLYRQLALTKVVDQNGQQIWEAKPPH